MLVEEGVKVGGQDWVRKEGSGHGGRDGDIGWAGRAGHRGGQRVTRDGEVGRGRGVAGGVTRAGTPLIDNGLLVLGLGACVPREDRVNAEFQHRLEG